MYIYIGIGGTYIHKSHFKRDVFIKNGSLNRLEFLRTNLKDVVSSPTVGKHVVRFAFLVLLAGRLSQYKWYQAWHSSEVIGAYRDGSFERKMARF